MENPTKYHVIQKQKSQVRQYLSESLQHPNGSEMLPHLQPRLCTPQTNIVPACTKNYNGTPTVTSLPGLLPQSQQTYQTGPSASPDMVSAMSPALSSAATSASEVSILLKFNKTIDVAVSIRVNKYWIGLFVIPLGSPSTLTQS